MARPSRGPWRSALALFPVLLVVLLGLLAATATAATVDQTGAESVPLGTGAGQFTSATYSGRFTSGMSNVAPPDPVTGSPCAGPAVDKDALNPLDPTKHLICDYVELNVQQTGTATVCVTTVTPFDPQIIIDLFIVGPNGSAIADTSMTAGSPTPCITFSAASTGVYQVHIDPSTIFGLTTFTGTISFSPTPSSNQGQGAGGGGGPLPSGTKMTGGGKLDDGGQFNVNVLNTDPSMPTDKGRVRYVNKAANCSIQSTTYTATVTVTGQDSQGHTTGKADVTANGTANGQSAYIEAHAEDNGEPNTNDRLFVMAWTDMFKMTAICGTTTLRQVANGQLQVHPTTT